MTSGRKPPIKQSKPPIVQQEYATGIEEQKKKLAELRN